MKKLVYLIILILGVTFTGCEPMEEIHEEVDARLEQETANAGTVAITLTEEDYEELGVDNPYFTSFDEANDVLPDFLAEEYPVLERGSIANVTAEVAEPFDSSLNNEVYEVTSEDYDEMGLKYGNFDNQADIFVFLNLRFADAEVGTLVELTYEWYSGSTQTVTNNFIKTGEDSWSQVLVLEKEDYQAMEEAYANFDSRKEAMQKLPIYLNRLYPYAAVGDTEDVLFEVHIGGGDTDSFLKKFTFDGTRWQGSFVTTLQFGHNGGEWEPDNTITYTLTPADFTYIGEQLADVYDDPAWSAGNYNNFDRRKGNRNYWSDEMLLEAVGLVLDRMHPSAEEGQKYVVSFDIYDGSAGTESISVIKQDGLWILNE